MSNPKQSFSIRASASRLEKGFLAIPQRFRGWFPSERGQILVVFDDEEKSKTLTYHPYGPEVKENRIFGVGRWFSKRGVADGDLISITLEDLDRRLYRIASDRYIREREERKARQKLQSAQTDAEAEQELRTLSRLTKKGPRQQAQEELLRIAQKSPRQPRPRVFPRPAERRENVPPGIRVLLRELHRGRCQLCSFTFQKRNGEPFFEIHHLDPGIGHHPSNLLVVCPNCHAQFEYAEITDWKWSDSWLIAVAINGKRVPVRQPLAHESIGAILVGLSLLVAVAQMGRFLVR